MTMHQDIPMIQSVMYEIDDFRLETVQFRQARRRIVDRYPKVRKPGGMVVGNAGINVGLFGRRHV
jgi:hypothetical protein